MSQPNLKSSGPFEMGKEDVAKTVRTFVLISVAAGLTWAIENAGDFELGVWQGVAVAGLTAALDAVRRYLRDNK